MIFLFQFMNYYIITTKIIILWLYYFSEAPKDPAFQSHPFTQTFYTQSQWKGPVSTIICLYDHQLLSIVPNKGRAHESSMSFSEHIFCAAMSCKLVAVQTTLC